MLIPVIPVHSVHDALMKLSFPVVAMVATIVGFVWYTIDLICTGTRVPIQDKNVFAVGEVTVAAGGLFFFIQLYAWTPGSGTRLLAFFTVFVVGCCGCIRQVFQKPK